MLTGKKFVYILVLCFLSAALPPSYLVAQEVSTTSSDQQEIESTTGNAAPEKVPHITVDAVTYDAGEIYEGKPITHTFKVKNTGTAKLTIKNVKAG